MMVGADPGTTVSMTRALFAARLDAIVYELIALFDWSLIVHAMELTVRSADESHDCTV